LIQRQWDTCGRGVPEAIHIHYHPLARYRKMFDRRIEDPNVRLMQDYQIHIFRPHARCHQNIVDAILDNTNRPFENRSAIHLQILTPNR